jgi:hypothetical protein
MQLYLCEKYDKDHKISFPYDSDEYWETVEWLVWMVSLTFLHGRQSVWWRQNTHEYRQRYVHATVKSPRAVWLAI